MILFFVRSYRQRQLPFLDNYQKHNTLKGFGEYVSFWSVTTVLISKRVQLCDKRHKKHQLHQLSPKMSLGRLSEAEDQILSMLPPRRSWVSLSRKSRYRELDDGNKQRKAAAKCNWTALKWTVKRDLAAKEEPLYLTRLKGFVAKIKERVRVDEFAFQTPVLFPDIKDESSCRPLCKFENLEDAVMLILANKYLTELFNDLFYEESLAFRSKRTYQGKNDYVTAHHDAIARIKEYRKRQDEKRLYVSECDLQKFYDTVSHKVVHECYCKLLKKAGKANPGICFNEINRVFDAYLHCYSFPRNVYRLNDKVKYQKFWEDNNVDDKQRKFKWVESELLAAGVAKSHRGLMRMQIGVPQGGALSGLIANMVLNSVDFQVKRGMKESDLYLRYCDDMIILSTNKARCKKLFSIYYNGSKRLNLVPHKPEKNLKFRTKDFWKGKSKDAYLWAMGQKDAAEWIGFVGYEIRRDGMMRIRKKSFRKELDKQTSVVFEKTLEKIKNYERVSDNSLVSSLERKLISMSVGKVEVWNAPFIESEMCWSAGFKELEMNPILARQLRELDRHRWMMHRAAIRRLAGMEKKGEDVVRRDLEELDEEKNPDSRGMVHSYYYQFKKKAN